jgi:hypothetical protein
VRRRHPHPHRSDRSALIHAVVIGILLIAAVLYAVAGVTVVIYGGLL